MHSNLEKAKLRKAEELGKGGEIWSGIVTVRGLSLGPVVREGADCGGGQSRVRVGPEGGVVEGHGEGAQVRPRVHDLEPLDEESIRVEVLQLGAVDVDGVGGWGRVRVQLLRLRVWVDRCWGLLDDIGG